MTASNVIPAGIDSSVPWIKTISCVEFRMFFFERLDHLGRCVDVPHFAGRIYCRKFGQQPSRASAQYQHVGTLAGCRTNEPSARAAWPFRKPRWTVYHRTRQRSRNCSFARRSVKAREQKTRHPRLTDIDHFWPTEL